MAGRMSWGCCSRAVNDDWTGEGGRPSRKASEGRTYTPRTGRSDTTLGLGGRHNECLRCPLTPACAETTQTVRLLGPLRSEKPPA